MASNGIHSLRDPRFLEEYNQRRKDAHDKLEKNANAKKAQLEKKINGVKKLQYKKQSNKDPGMPKELQDQRLRCVEWMARPSPTASPTASDDEGDDILAENATAEEQEGEMQFDVMDCVDGLMEFATQAGGGGDDTVHTCGI